MHKPITALQLLKTLEPEIVRSLYQQIEPPDKFYNFGYSTRFKIIKAVQARLHMPNITDRTNRYIEFFNILSTDVEDHWTVQQQWSAAKWACEYNEESAATLLLHYGWSPKLQNKCLMRGNSMHSLTPMEDGIRIEMTYTHTFQERMDAACAAIDEAIRGAPFSKKEMSSKVLDTIGISRFHLFKKKYISLDNELRQSYIGKIRHYVSEAINPLREEPLVVPQIDEPELLPDDIFTLRWDEFGFGTSSSLKAHLNGMRREECRTALWRKIGHLDFSQPYANTELGLHDSARSAAIKHGFLVPAGKRGKSPLYKINIDEGDEN